MTTDHVFPESTPENAASAPRPVTVIVLAWNRWQLTRSCLASIEATDLTGVEVMVVDNGSTDETPTELAKIEWIRVLTLPRNLGFVRGNNAGIAECAPGSDVLLLNNDVVVTDPAWLQSLRACARSSPDIGVVGCRLRLADGRLLHAGTYILADTMWGQQIGSLEKDLGQYPGVRDVQGIVFACAYITRETLDAIGTLALDFESYFEDTDYCLRARKAGFRTVVCGGVTLTHDEHGSTHGQAEARLALFERSRAVFRPKWSAALDAHYTQDLLWQSILNFPTGYATSSREILASLDEQGVRVAYRYVYGPGSVFPVPEAEASGNYRLDVISRRQVPRTPAVSVVYGQGDVFLRNRGKRKIGYTMLEVDGFPEDWVRQANRMDEVWVPTEFNRQGFLRCGLERPIHVVPLGVNPDYFHPGVRHWPNPNGDMVFLSCFEWGERKDPWLLLKAFSEEFSAKEPVRLVCKIMNRDPGVSLKREIQDLGLRSAGGRISYLLNLEFPHYQLSSLYRSADCFVAASRGEGWDMPLMEALACGVPAIATDWGGHTEFMNERIGYPLRVRRTMRAVAKCPYYAGFSWAEPDSDHLRHLLRTVFEDRDEAARRGQRAAVEILERWTWRHTAQRITQRLNES